jgi:biopolymer transport protein ExbD
MILAALVTPPGFEKELPNHSNNTSQNQNQHNDIEVVVNAHGVIFVDGQRTDTQGIYRVMTLTRIKRGNKHVSVTADTKAPYGVIIRILDAAKEAGLEDVGFVTS